MKKIIDGRMPQEGFNMDFSKPLSIEEMRLAKADANYCWKCDGNTSAACIQIHPEQLLFWVDRDTLMPSQLCEQEYKKYVATYAESFIDISFGEYLKRNKLYVVPKPSYRQHIPFWWFDQEIQ